MIRAQVPTLLAGVAITAMVATFLVNVAGQQDPSARSDVVRPADRREKRLGHLSHAETSSLIARLRGELARARTPQDRAIRTLRLTDVYLGRKMHSRATSYLERARQLAPRMPEVAAREALLLHHQGRRAEARRLIREVAARAPGNADVGRVAKVILAGP